MYEIKVISKKRKKRFLIFVGGTVECSKALWSLKNSLFYLKGHFLVYQNKVISKKMLFILGGHCYMFQISVVSKIMVIVLERTTFLVSQNKVISKKNLYFRHAINVLVLL